MMFLNGQITIVQFRHKKGLYVVRISTNGKNPNLQHKKKPCVLRNTPQRSEIYFLIVSLFAQYVIKYASDRNNCTSLI